MFQLSALMYLQCGLVMAAGLVLRVARATSRRHRHLHRIYFHLGWLMAALAVMGMMVTLVGNWSVRGGLYVTSLGVPGVTLFLCLAVVRRALDRGPRRRISAVPPQFRKS